ncbi:MAG: sulfotransferase, partial [Pseudomonadota bacterium]
MSSTGDSAGVPSGLYLRTRISRLLNPFWPTFSRLESFFVGDELAGQEIDRPVYVTGIARAGTTIVTEMLAASLELTSHQYADFPFLFTPYWRNYLAQRSQVAAPKAIERAHKDRILVSANSPEAFEEVLWMLFDPALHYKYPIRALGPNDAPEGFPDFYRDHVKKLLAVRGASRYLAKGNYNLLRLRWLADCMEDPRVIIMVRQPSWHVASLMKQHALFNEAQRIDQRTRWQLAASGHFEFGPQRVAPVYLDNDAQQVVVDLWSSGDEVRGWAKLWAQGYALAREYLEDSALQRQLLLVRYEDLCGEPEKTLSRIADHCQLDGFDKIAERYVPQLRPPQYYEPGFTDAQLA